MPRNSLNGTGRHFPEPGVSEHQTESAIDDDALEALAELAEAEAAEAAARAKVARARARAARLRLPEARIPNAEEGAAPGDEDDQVELDPVADGDDKHAESEPEAEGDVVDEPGITHPVASPKSVGFWRRRPRWSRLALVAGILGTCGFVAITAVMLWQHHNVEAQHQRDAAFVNAARHDVEALLSIDYSKASEDVQHVIDSSTGKFHDEFAKDAKNFIEAAQKAKAVNRPGFDGGSCYWISTSGWSVRFVA